MTIARVMAAKASTTIHTASPDMIVQDVVHILAASSGSFPNGT